MKHAGKESLANLCTLLEALREHTGLVERTPGSLTSKPTPFEQVVCAAALATIATPAFAHGGELAVASVAVISLVAGAVPGAWVAFRGLERSRGHLWLAGLVGILAVAAVTFYTVAGAPEELFSRVVMLPLTLLIALAGTGLLIGIPMYAGYLFTYRLVTYLFRKGGRAIVSQDR